LRRLQLRFIFGIMPSNRKAAFDRYLRQLKASGRTNMYGAVPYLMKAFDLSREAAFVVICEWLDRHTESAEIHPSKSARQRRRS
jgi:hypothetical protein